MEKKHMSDKTKISILRWWFVGASYFFIAMGTSLAEKTDSLDLIFFLGIGIGIVNVLIFHPIIYHMFDIRRRGKIQNKKYFERGILANVGLSLAEIFKCLFLVILVFLVYQCINVFILTIMGAEDTSSVILAGEPILFALLFTVFYNLLASIVDKVWIEIEKSSKANENKDKYDE
ncbi:MAG: hypothetical protein R3Y32_00645 [Bacillota bacterium]